VVHTCHLKVQERLRSGGSQFQGIADKKFLGPHLNGKKLGMVSPLATEGSLNRKTVVQTDLGKKQNPRIIRAKKAWWR
jgi:hypothetical protein